MIELTQDDIPPPCRHVVFFSVRYSVKEKTTRSLHLKRSIPVRDVYIREQKLPRKENKIRSTFQIFIVESIDIHLFCCW